MSCNTCDGMNPRWCPDIRHKDETFTPNLQEHYGPPIWGPEERVSKVWPILEAAERIIDHCADVETDCCVNGMRDRYHSSYGCPESIENGCPGHEEPCTCDIGQAFELLRQAKVLG